MKNITIADSLTEDRSVLSLGIGARKFFAGYYYYAYFFTPSSNRDTADFR